VQIRSLEVRKPDELEQAFKGAKRANEPALDEVFQ